MGQSCYLNPGTPTIRGNPKSQRPNCLLLSCRLLPKDGLKPDFDRYVSWPLSPSLKPVQKNLECPDHYLHPATLQTLIPKP